MTVSKMVVEYRETRTFGQYQNVTVGLTVEGSNEDESETLFCTAKTWVQGKLDERIDEHESHAVRQHQEDRMNWDLQDIEAKVARAKARYQEIQEFVAKLGVNLEDMPF